MSFTHTIKITCAVCALAFTVMFFYANATVPTKHERLCMQQKQRANPTYTECLQRIKYNLCLRK